MNSTLASDARGPRFDPACGEEKFRWVDSSTSSIDLPFVEKVSD